MGNCRLFLVQHEGECVSSQKTNTGSWKDKAFPHNSVNGGKTVFTANKMFYLLYLFNIKYAAKL